MKRKENLHLRTTLTVWDVQYKKRDAQTFSAPSKMYLFVFFCRWWQTMQDNQQVFARPHLMDRSDRWMCWLIDSRNLMRVADVQWHRMVNMNLFKDVRITYPTESRGRNTRLKTRTGRSRCYLLLRARACVLYVFVKCLEEHGRVEEARERIDSMATRTWRASQPDAA